MFLADLPFNVLKVGMNVRSANGNPGRIVQLHHDPAYIPSDTDGDIVEIHWPSRPHLNSRLIHNLATKVELVDEMAIEFVNNCLIMNADRYVRLKTTSNIFLSNFDLVAIVFDMKTHGQDGVKVLKTRFWDPKSHEEVITFDKFKYLCEEHIKND